MADITTNDYSESSGLKTQEQPAATSQKEADAQTAASANTKSYADYINQMYDTKQQQQEQSIDYQVQTNVNNTQREYEDQVDTYKKNYRNTTSQMYQGADNAALNSRAAGQYGGTSTQNVGAVQSQYQAQRAELATQQKKLANDAIREIQQLRLQGEYDKADALMQNTQAKLQALYEDAIRVDENITTNAQYQTTLDREDAAIQREKEVNDLNYTRQMGMTLLSYGIIPDDTMLEAMGMSKEVATSYAKAMKLYG